jgi:hypothetical protein
MRKTQRQEMIILENLIDGNRTSSLLGYGATVIVACCISIFYCNIHPEPCIGLTAFIEYRLKYCLALQHLEITLSGRIIASQVRRQLNVIQLIATMKISV